MSPATKYEAKWCQQQLNQKRDVSDSLYCIYHCNVHIRRNLSKTPSFFTLAWTCQNQGSQLCKSCTNVNRRVANWRLENGTLRLLYACIDCVDSTIDKKYSALCKQCSAKASACTYADRTFSLICSTIVFREVSCKWCSVEKSSMQSKSGSLIKVIQLGGSGASRDRWTKVSEIAVALNMDHVQWALRLVWREKTLLADLIATESCWARNNHNVANDHQVYLAGAYCARRQ